MLADKDRIFTNLYGRHDWTLDGARKRGAWQDTRTFIDRGRDWIVNEVKGSGLREWIRGHGRLKHKAFFALANHCIRADISGPMPPRPINAPRPVMHNHGSQ